MTLQSTVKCPKCAFEVVETMPTDRCQVLYRCKNCGNVMRPKEGDCCIFCSYGSVKCPSMQD